jgi:GNAT superfamily N-acetyltransferase
MLSRPQREPGALPPDAFVRRLFPVSVSIARQLYDRVGAAYHWVDRTHWSWEQLQSVVCDPGVETWLLMRAGQLAGYYELDARSGTDVEVAYFGLFPAFVGQGLGRGLLDHAIARAWNTRPNRVWLHTCSLDHPAALPLYRTAGFVPYKETTRHQRLDRGPIPTSPALPAFCID